jgi:hypothetical protein
MTTAEIKFDVPKPKGGQLDGECDEAAEENGDEQLAVGDG